MDIAALKKFILQMDMHYRIIEKALQGKGVTQEEEEFISEFSPIRARTLALIKQEYPMNPTDSDSASG